MTSAIIQRNLALLNGSDEGSLKYARIKSRESIGGNAGIYEGNPCFGANFFYDGDNGEIKYFGNCQEVPEEIRRNHSGALRIAWMPRNIRIVELVIDTEVDKTNWALRGLKAPSPEARRTLEETVDEFNKLFGHA